MKQLVVLIICVFALVSCNGTKKNESNLQTVSEPYRVEYAKGFNISKLADYTEVTVNNPWDSTQILRRYILVDKSKQVPQNLPEGILIRTPLADVVVYSTIHCTVLKHLESLNVVRGVCEPDYIDIDFITNGIKDGSIIDLGLASNPNVEKLIMIDPEAIWATPIQGLTYGSIEKTKIPIIETPDYMEASPLARAEWIRFYSVFFGKEQLADSLFNDVVDKYNGIKKQLSEVTDRPTVFTDLKYGNVWYMPGGKSYISNMLQDAGATYVWADNEATGSVSFPFEEVLDKAGDTSFWLIKYNQPTEMTYHSLEKEFKPYSYFAAFKNRNIYGCNSGKTSYYEDLPVRPDYVLQDLAYIFHPELFPDYEPLYYKKLAE